MAEPFTAIASLLWTMLSTVVKGYDTRRRDYFKTHIEPLQVQMTSIHKDYVAGFEEARRHIKDDMAPPEQLIEFLRERRRDYDCERQLARDLAAELERVRKSGLKGKTWDAVERYCNAIVRYFWSGGEISDLSWYTDFLSIVESKASSGFDHTWQTLAVSGYPDQTLLKRLNLVLDKDLPKAFADVTKSYAELKVRLQ